MTMLNAYYDLTSGNIMALGTKKQILGFTGEQFEQSIEYARAVGILRSDFLYIDNRKKILTQDTGFENIPV